MARTKNRYNAVNKQKNEMESTHETWRTGLYARLSVELINRKSESIENQLEIMRKYISGKPEFAEFYEYTDKGYTGTDFHRPAFENMMEDVKSGKINCIIVKDLSRLGRDYLETSNLIETIFPFLGVRFISVNDHFDTSKDHNGNKELEIALKNLVNDMYARDVSKRVSSSRKQEQIRGKFLGSNAPYGYTVNKEHPLRQLIVDEPAAEVVRSIYEMVLSGLTLREISINLQEQKLSIPGQYFRTGHLYWEQEDEVKLWRIGTISNILHNQLYIGNMVQGRRKTRHYKGEERHFTDKDEWIIVEDTHQPIVSKEIFEEVQQILLGKVENSTFSSDRTKNIPIKENRFKGILYCGICGERLGYASSVSNGVETERKYYFSCSGKYDLQTQNHIGIRITEKSLEEILKELIGDLLRKFNQADQKLTKTIESELETGLAKWKKDIQKAERKLMDLDAVSSVRYEEYVLGNITREEFISGKSVAEEKREMLELEIGEIREKQISYESGIREKMHWLLGLGKASEGELDSELIQLLITRIELHPNHELRITWRFSETDILERNGE